MITLVAVARDNLDSVLALAVAPGQERFVASTAKTLAQAAYHPEMAWVRAIARDGELVGLVALAFEGGRPPALWRLLVDARWQRMGVGRAVVTAVAEVARERVPDAAALRVSHVPGEGDPGRFYEGLGFRYTGEEEEGERVMELPLAGPPTDRGGRAAAPAS